MARCMLEVLTFWICFHGVFSVCPQYLITTEDIQTAVRAAEYVYKDGATTGKTIPKTSFKIKHTSIKFLFLYGTGVKVIVADHGKTRIIAYRGSQSKKQLVAQFITFLTKTKGIYVNMFGKRVSVNAYFWEAFQILYNEIKAYLNDKTRKYIITGHSLGGAMASLLAIVGKEKHNIWQNIQSSLITFGQPRTGDTAYADIHDEKINSFRKLRFTNDLDPIPQLPVPFAPEMKHHSREVWMSKQIFWGERYWKVCGSKDTGVCSKRFRLFPNVNDHSVRRYKSRIVILPSVYEDQNGDEYGKWKDAVRNTCS